MKDWLKILMYLVAIAFLLIEIIKTTEIVPQIKWFFYERIERRREEQRERDEVLVYFEHPTKCDTCEIKSDACCLLDITTALDSQKHFISGIGGRCEKEEGGDNAIQFEK